MHYSMIPWIFETGRVSLVDPIIPHKKEETHISATISARIQGGVQPSQPFVFSVLLLPYSINVSN